MNRIIFPLVFGLVGVGILLSLGVWQIQRLAWKEGIIAEIDARIGDVPVVLPASVAPETDKYRAVEVAGDFTGDELHVLVSRKNIGAGYRVVAAMQTTDGRRIMVDRGFIKPDVKDQGRAATSIKVSGHLHWPQETDGYTPEADLAGNIWFARDVPAMASVLNTEEVFVVAKITTATNPSLDPMPIDTLAIPNNHLQYAITWFSLAVIWGAMTGYFIWRSRAFAQRS